MSSTSEEVSPKWIQRPDSPAEAASTSTNAAMSWSVTCSRSFTASTVNVAPRIASSSLAVGPPSPSREGNSSQAATSTRRQVSMRAPSVHRAPSSGRV